MLQTAKTFTHWNLRYFRRKCEIANVCFVANKDALNIMQNAWHAHEEQETGEKCNHKNARVN